MGRTRYSVRAANTMRGPFSNDGAHRVTRPIYWIVLLNASGPTSFIDSQALPLFDLHDVRANIRSRRVLQPIFLDFVVVRRVDPLCGDQPAINRRASGASGPNSRLDLSRTKGAGTPAERRSKLAR